jgi:predicted RNase H-like HicB family nuclease
MPGKDTFDELEPGVPSRGVTVRVVIYAGEDGYVVAECPELPGCASQGQTREDALANVREAIEGWLDVEAEAGSEVSRRRVEIVELAV